jgi:hypothetical protein
MKSTDESMVMTKIHLLLAFVALGILAIPMSPVAAQQEGGTQDRPMLQAHPLTGVIRLDGVLSEPIWAEAAVTFEFITLEPEEGGAPIGRTEAKVLVSPTELIIGLWAYDDDPAGIVSYAMARDVELDDEDHVVIILDTYRDERTGYVFAINPSGSRFDGLVVEQGEDVNPNWDAIWEAATSQDPSGRLRRRRTETDGTPRSGSPSKAWASAGTWTAGGSTSSVASPASRKRAAGPVPISTTRSSSPARRESSPTCRSSTSESASR